MVDLALLNRSFDDERAYFDPITLQNVDDAMNEGAYLVREDAPEMLIGCVHVTTPPFANGYRRVGQLAVEPSLRRTGHGRQLMEAAEQLLRNEGCPGVKIGVLNFKEHLLKFYRPLGYQETGEFGEPQPASKERCHLIIMSKRLG